MTEEQQRLVTEHIGLAKSISKRFKAKRPQLWSEYESDSMYALVSSAINYDPSQGAFGTYAYKRIEGAMLTAHRSLMPAGFVHAKEGSYPVTEPMTTDDWIVEQQDAVGHDAEVSDEFDQAMDSLPPLNAHVMRSIYRDRKTQDQIAVELGTYQDTISTIHARSIDILKYEHLRKMFKEIREERRSSKHRDGGHRKLLTA